MEAMHTGLSERDWALVRGTLARIAHNAERLQEFKGIRNTSEPFRLVCQIQRLAENPLFESKT